MKQARQGYLYNGEHYCHNCTPRGTFLSGAVDKRHYGLCSICGHRVLIDSYLERVGNTIRVEEIL